MSTNAVIALAGVLTGLGATSAAVVAAYALRAQQRSLQRQHDLENMRWLTDQYAGLLDQRRRAARSLLNGPPDEDALWQVINFYARCGNLIRQGFITEEAFTGRVGEFAVLGWWYSTEAMIQAARTRLGADLLADFEWLSDRMRSNELEPDGDWVEGLLRYEAGLAIRADEARADPQGSDASN